MNSNDLEFEGKCKELEIKLADESSSRSLEWYGKAHGNRSKIEISTVLRHLKLKDYHHVLDIGCGVGRLTLEIAPRVQWVFATDISPRCVEQLKFHMDERNLKNITTKCSDINKLMLEANTFDRATAVEIIQHLPKAENRIDAVERIYQSLKPGGIFVTVNYRWGGTIRDRKEGTHRDGRYYYSFTATEMKELLDKCGFVSTRVGGCLVLPYRLYRYTGLLYSVIEKIDVALSFMKFLNRYGMFLIGSGIKK
jgi:2-polyprenyl-3-methyl-5-hydroxy-6-metoxy-1,4-benzoquinol methylase